MIQNTETGSDRPDNTHVYRAMRAAGARVIRRGKFEFLRLRNPGAQIPRADQRPIVMAFATITDTLCQADTQQYWEKRPRYLSELTEVWTVHLEGALVGFSGLRLLPLQNENVLFVDTLNVRPRALSYKFAGYSLGTVFVHEIFTSYYVRMRGALPFAFRTQNPHVYRLAKSILPHGVYPSVDGSKARDPERGAHLAAALAGYLSPGKPFDARASVVRGALGRSLYAETSPAMRTRDAALLKYWKEHVGVAQGDALVIVAMPKLSEAAALALRYAGMVLLDRAKQGRKRGAAATRALQQALGSIKLNRSSLWAPRV